MEKRRKKGVEKRRKIRENFGKVPHLCRNTAQKVGRMGPGTRGGGCRTEMDVEGSSSPICARFQSCLPQLSRARVGAGSDGSVRHCQPCTIPPLLGVPQR